MHPSQLPNINFYGNGNGRRTNEFKKAQDLFWNNRALLIDTIPKYTKSILTGNAQPELHIIENHYANIFEILSRLDLKSILDQKARVNSFIPISKTNVKNGRLTKFRTSA